VQRIRLILRSDTEFRSAFRVWAKNPFERVMARMPDRNTLLRDLKRISESEYFDADWYQTAYPDVGYLGMLPAEHYVKYGGILRRDPGPNFCTSFYLDTHTGGSLTPTNALLHCLDRWRGKLEPDTRCVLWAAQNVAETGEHNRAVELATRYLPAHLEYSSAILRANQALALGTEQRWLAHLNAYLTRFDIAPICLAEGVECNLLERLSTTPLPPVTGGPLVTVIMPAWNAEDTVTSAARSILNQTWQNLELLIVDDASEDGTWAKLKKLARSDGRVRVLRNKINVGPYVSKNVALMNAKGDWITGHDADDWAHPQRIEKHLEQVRESETKTRASVTYMIRIEPKGRVGHISKIGEFSFDGVARLASISCLFERDLLKNTLGYWDSVRFGADSEMISRAKAVLGPAFKQFPLVNMLCLDDDRSLTNHPEHGIRTPIGLSHTRRNYKLAWAQQHQQLTAENCYVEFNQQERKYPSDYDHAVSKSEIEQLELNVKQA